MTLTFGPYRGRDIKSEPSEYLKWIAQNHIDESLREVAEAEYDRRTDHVDHFFYRQ